MGALTVVMQVFLPGIPLPAGKLELADIPAILGSAFAGPIGGIINGFLYGITIPSAAVFVALIPASIISLSLLGFLSKNLHMSWISILIARVIINPIAKTFLLVYLFYPPDVMILPVYVLALSYDIPGALVSIPIYALVKRQLPSVDRLY